MEFFLFINAILQRFTQRLKKVEKIKARLRNCKNTTKAPNKIAIENKKVKG